MSKSLPQQNPQYDTKLHLIVRPQFWKLGGECSTSLYLAIGLISRVFANGPGDWGSILSRVIPKTQKTVLDAAWLSTQHYKVRIESKVEQS